MNRKRDKLANWFGLRNRSPKQKDSHDDTSRRGLEAEVGTETVGSSVHAGIEAATEPDADLESQPGQAPEQEQAADHGPQDGPLQSVWQIAWDTLTLSDRLPIDTVVKGSNCGENIFSDLERIAQQSKQNLHDYRGNDDNQTTGKDSVRVRLAISKIITCMRRFKEVGDIAVNFDPAHAALPWAAFRFVLEALTVNDEQRELLFSGLERVSFLGLRVKVYEQLYLAVSPENSNEPVAHLKQGMVQLCRDMLVFMAMAIKRLNQTIIAHTMTALFDPSAVSDVLTSITFRASQVDIEASNCERFLNLQDRKQLQGLITEELINIDARIEEQWVRLLEDERSELLQWLSPIHYASDHEFAKRGRIADTGSWILERKAFGQWETSESSEIFWLHGIPGAGKTKLTSKVIDYTKTQLDTSRNKETVVYFYCDRNRSDHQDPASVVRSFIRQLSADTDNDEDVCKIVEEQWRLEKRKGFPSKELPFETCKQLLPMLVAAHAETIMFLDGLDECDKETRHELVYLLKSLTDDPKSLLKVFISSREDRDLFKNFINRTHLRVQANDNDDDIKAYVLAQLQSTPNPWFRERLSPELKLMIIQNFADKSDGMFQWAVLQMHDLLKLKRASDVKAYLGTLPIGLEKAYERILNDIGDQTGSAPVIAARALRWIMDSARPLSPEELTAAVCNSSDSLMPQDPDIDTEFVLEACHNLVVIMGSTCRFAHLSVQEYLESHDWPNKPDVQLLGDVCLRLLMASDDTISSSLLSVYATDQWHKHLTGCDPASQEATVVTGHLLSEFLGDPTESSHHYRRWWASTHVWPGYYRDWEQKWAAFGAVTFGLLATVTRWIQDGILDPSLSSPRVCLLHLAVESDNLAMCSLLLEAGADVNYSSVTLGTPLLRAVIDRQLSIIELLVKKPGIDVDKGRDSTGASALCNAIAMGDCRVVELLLDAGANPNLMEECESSQRSAYDGFQPALHIAADRGGINIVRTLIRRGADVNLVAGQYQTALTTAVHEHCSDVVQCLVQNGADVNLFRPLYQHLDNNRRRIDNIAMALVNGGALDYVLDLPRGERTKLDEIYESVINWLDEQLAKTDKERRKRRSMRMFDAGAFRTTQGDERGGSERGGDEDGDSENADGRSVRSI